MDKTTAKINSPTVGTLKGEKNKECLGVNPSVEKSRFVEISPERKSEIATLLPTLKRLYWIQKSHSYFESSVKLPTSFESCSGWNLLTLTAKLKNKKGFSQNEIASAEIEEGEFLTAEELRAKMVG